MLMSELLRQYFVLPEQVVAMSIATDGLGIYKAKVLMVALEHPATGKTFSIMIEGGDVVSGCEFHHISKDIYDRLAVSVQQASVEISKFLTEVGGQHLLAHANFAFASPMVKNNGIESLARCTTIDLAHLHFLSFGFHGDLAKITTFNDLQLLIGRTEGKRIRCKLDELAEIYKVQEEKELLVPQCKVKQTAAIFRTLLGKEVPFV